MKKKTNKTKQTKKKSVDYMHSSCIVVRLDWAAGLPAWLIRRFGSPDLTRKTLFTSQKHQSHSSWDRNEDSWLTLSTNIYQFLGIAKSYTHHLDGTSRSYWLWPGYAISVISVFFSKTTKWQVYDHTLKMSKISPHAGWKTSFSVNYSWN